MSREITRCYISMPSDWHEAFLDHAAEHNTSLSELLRLAGAAKLPKEVRSKLSKPRKVGRPKMKTD